MNEHTLALTLLKSNLGFFDAEIPQAIETFLQTRIDVAVYELTTNCKLTLVAGNTADEDLIAMYAAWLYNQRITGNTKPPMLQMAIRNRQVNEAPPLEDDAV